MPASSIYLGILGSLIASLGTGLGALPTLFIKRITQNVQGVMLGFGAGVMLAATAFSLIIPGLEAADDALGNTVTAALIVTTGIILGGVFLWLSHQYFPHEHFFKGREGSDVINLKRVWLFVIAIAIHNFPEGLAVGVGFGGENIANGIALTAGIFLQNIPEGLVVSLSLLSEGYSRRQSITISALTGLVELVGGITGAIAITIAQPVLPIAMGFAAGAMLFVICDEIIPESNRLGYEKAGTIGVMSGFVLMMFLDVTLG
ncbi:ZIP family metal transporter [Egbenema bharatensis]|uniref:ZIP family metal transporter n=1 Tax=Egbenema bharatensis TaxID=3463334 RepID=UPI003A866FFF